MASQPVGFFRQVVALTREVQQDKMHIKELLVANRTSDFSNRL